MILLTGRELKKKEKKKKGNKDDNVTVTLTSSGLHPFPEKLSSILKSHGLCSSMDYFTIAHLLHIYSH